jgi:hypothetical protein
MTCTLDSSHCVNQAARHSSFFSVIYSVSKLLDYFEEKQVKCENLSLKGANWRQRQAARIILPRILGYSLQNYRHET